VSRDRRGVAWCLLTFLAELREISRSAEQETKEQGFYQKVFSRKKLIHFFLKSEPLQLSADLPQSLRHDLFQHRLKGAVTLIEPNS
jgi:hypothetical protein